MKNMQRTYYLVMVLWLGWTAGLKAQPSLVISNLTGRTGPVTLAWTAADTNFAFTVQSADALSGSIWLNGPWNAAWPTTLNTWTDPRASIGSARFYRVLRVAAAQRGSLLQTNSVGSITQALLTAIAQQQGLPIAPLYGVSYHRLTYETIDPVGGRTQASGLLCLPLAAPIPCAC